MKIIFEGDPEQVKKEIMQFLQVPAEKDSTKPKWERRYGAPIPLRVSYEKAWNIIQPDSQKLLLSLTKKNNWISLDELASITNSSSNHWRMGAIIANASRVANKYSLPIPVVKRRGLNQTSYILHSAWTEFLRPKTELQGDSQ